MVDLLEKINTNIWYALLLLIALTLLFHTFLVWRKNLSKRRWKQLDYIWISLTALSLFGATRKAEVTINSAKLNLTHLAVEGRFRLLCQFVENRESSWLCTKMQRNEYSPKNFDEEQAEYDSTCSWSKYFYQYLIALDTTDRKPIDTASLAPLKIKSGQLVQYKEGIWGLINFYNEVATEEVQQKKALEQSEWDFMFVFFSPLLLIMALALRLTKITGEIKYEK